MVAFFLAQALSFLSRRLRMRSVVQAILVVFLDVAGCLGRVAKRFNDAEQSFEFSVHSAHFVAEQRHLLHGILAGVAGNCTRSKQRA